MNEISQIMVNLIKEKNFVVFFFAFITGVITSFTPCSLSSISLIIGYIGSSKESKKGANLKISLYYALGISLTFTFLAFITAYFGKIFSLTNSIWYILLGFLMVLMSLQIWELFNIIPSSYLTSKNKIKGNLGAFITGILSGIFSSPCSTPILIVLLGVIAQQGDILYGITLLLFYSFGNNLIVIAAGIFIGSIRKITLNKNYGLFTYIMRYSTGGIVLIIGFYLLYTGF